MHPEIRAIADRFIYEQATLKHITAQAPEEALRREVLGYGWSVGQLLAHLAVSLETYRGVVERWLAREDALKGFDPPSTNAHTAEEHREVSRAKLRELFGAGLVGLVETLSRVPDERLGETVGPGTIVEVLRGPFGNHALSHAIALIDALPEVRLDPLVFNWISRADFESSAEREWQLKLLADVREYVLSLPVDEEDEE
jgi:hypothetical protein